MNPETTLMNKLRLALTKMGVMNFRNNVGMGWVGKSIRCEKAGMYHLNPGDVIVRNARPLHAGLCEGSSDIIAIKTVIVTPEMVGDKHGLFVGAEVKTPRGRVTLPQHQFIDNINDAGGIGIIARSEDDLQVLKS